MRDEIEITSEELLNDLEQGRREQDRLASKASKLEEDMDALNAKFQDIYVKACKLFGKRKRHARLAAQQEDSIPWDEIIVKAAQSGVTSVTVQPVSHRGRFLATVEDEAPFYLSRNLGVLFDILVHAEPSPDPADPFPCWLTKEELATRLEARIGTPFNAHAVDQLRYRLMKTLCKAKVNPHLVQFTTHSIRFAVRVRPQGSEKESHEA